MHSGSTKGSLDELATYTPDDYYSDLAKGARTVTAKAEVVSDEPAPKRGFPLAKVAGVALGLYLLNRLTE